MTRTHTIDRRRAGVAALAAALVAAVVLAGVPTRAGAAEEDALGGYTLTALGSPLSMRFFERVVPIPTDPGEPKFEGSLSFTRTVLKTGPASRAVASSAWPGPAFGDGFATICDCDQDYAVMVDARTPGEQQEASKQAPGGGGMYARADGADVFAQATAGTSPNPEAVGFDEVASRSWSTIEEGVAVSRVVSEVSGFALAGGVVAIDNITTELVATSDGASATVRGGPTVSGLTIAGNGYRLTEEGLQPMREGDAEESPFGATPQPPGQEELWTQLGIKVELVPGTATVEEASADARSAGVRITVDTGVLRGALADPVNQLYGSLPPELAAELAVFFELAPKVEILLGRAEVDAAASLPIEFDFDLAPPPLPPPPTSGGDFAVGSGPAFSSPGGFAPAAPDFAAPEVAAPDEAPAVAGPSLSAARAVPPGFGGIGALAILLGLLAAAAGARGLTALTTAAFAAAAGDTCPLPRGVPYLHDA